MIKRARRWALTIKQDVVALYIAGRDPRTPWYATSVALAVALYAFSPIDLIPDFIPILGLLDDVVILPLGILLAARLIPAGLMVEFRRTAIDLGQPPAYRAGAAVIVAIWIAGSIALVGWLWPRLH